MRHLRTITATGGLATALVLALGLATGPAHAASTVDVTYDLSDSELRWEFSFGTGFRPVNNGDFSVNGTIDGSMKVRYASDSSSGMPVVHGGATMLTFNITARSLSIKKFITAYGGPGYTGNTGTGLTMITGTLHWQLTAPATGNLTSGGALTGINAKMLMTGTARCGFADVYPSYCGYYVGLPTFTVFPSYTRSGPISLAGSAGPAGGAQSTRHTLSGRGRAIGWKPGAGIFALGSDHNQYNDYGGAFIVGREVLREADGHETKVIPEPGTLLLLGAGAAGLGLLSRRRGGRRG